MPDPPEKPENRMNRSRRRGGRVRFRGSQRSTWWVLLAVAVVALLIYYAKQQQRPLGNRLRLLPAAVGKRQEHRQRQHRGDEGLRRVQDAAESIPTPSRTPAATTRG